MTPEGERIIAILQSMERNSYWLARKIGMNPPTLRAKITGRRSWRPGDLERIAEFLGIPVEELKREPIHVRS